MPTDRKKPRKRCESDTYQLLDFARLVSAEPETYAGKLGFLKNTYKSVINDLFPAKLALDNRGKRRIIIPIKSINIYRVRRGRFRGKIMKRIVYLCIVLLISILLVSCSQDTLALSDQGNHIVYAQPIGDYYEAVNTYSYNGQEMNCITRVYAKYGKDFLIVTVDSRVEDAQDKAADLPRYRVSNMEVELSSESANIISYRMYDKKSVISNFGLNEGITIVGHKFEADMTARFSVLYSLFELYSESQAYDASIKLTYDIQIGNAVLEGQMMSIQIPVKGSEAVNG